MPEDTEHTQNQSTQFSGQFGGCVNCRRSCYYDCSSSPDILSDGLLKLFSLHLLKSMVK